MSLLLLFAGGTHSAGTGPAVGSGLLLEDGFYLRLEDNSFLLLE